MLKITLYNTAGEIDSRQAVTYEGALDAAIELLQRVPYLWPGDKLTVEEV